MKRIKTMICVLATIFVFSMCIAGCGNKEAADQSEAPAETADIKILEDDAEVPAAAPAEAEEIDEAADAEALAQSEYDRAVELYNQGMYYSARTAFENSGYEDWEARAASCVLSMPESGELWHDDNLVSDNMQLVFTVYGDYDGVGYYIRVYTEDRALAETVFVRKGGTVETWLPGGNYYIKDGSGTEWYGENEQFGPDGAYENMVFNEVEGDAYLTVLDEGYSWTIGIEDSEGNGDGVEAEAIGWEDRE